MDIEVSVIPQNDCLIYPVLSVTEKKHLYGLHEHTLA